MLKHYITKYGQDGKKFAEAWLQFNIFGLTFCFWKRRIELV